MNQPTQNDKNIINLIGNYFSEFIYCLDLNHSSNQNLQLFQNHFNFFNNNNYLRTNIFYNLLSHISKNDTLLPREFINIFNTLTTDSDEVYKIETFHKIQSKLNYSKSSFKKNNLEIEEPFNHNISHSLIIDKRFINSHEDLLEHKTNLAQVLSIFKSYNVELPFLPNFHLAYEKNPKKRGHLNPSNNHILVNNDFVNTSTFMHELTHFIDYVCANEKNLYSIEYHHGKKNNQLPLFNKLLDDLDNAPLKQDEKVDTLIKTLKYYFNIDSTHSDINNNLKSFLDTHVSNSFLKDEFENYIDPDSQSLKSLFTTMSEYFDKKSNKNPYFNQPHERLARISQSVLEDDGNKLINEGYYQHKVIIPLGHEKNHYVNSWLNVLEKEVGNYIKNNHQNILNIQAKNTQFFDIKDKIELNRNNQFNPELSLKNKISKNRHTNVIQPTLNTFNNKK